MRRSSLVVLSTLVLGAPASAQDAPAPAPPPITTSTTSAQELLKALKDAGVDVSTLTTVNQDGSVTVRMPAPPPAPPDAAAELPPPEGAAPPTDAAIPPPPAAAEPPKNPAVVWDNKLTLGFGIASGNTQNANVNALYNLTRKTDWTNLAFDAAYFYSEDGGEKSENQFTAGITHDWIIKNTRWLIFADARYDYDEFQSWRHRFAAHVGPGYKLIDNDKIKLTLRAGAGPVKEWLSDNDDWRPEGLAGFDFDWKITKNQSFVTSFRLFPDFDEWGEFRTWTTAGWQMKIDKADGLALTLGLLHEYQSVVDDGRDQNDLKIFGGILFDF